MRGRPLPSAVHRIGPHAQSDLHLFKLICPSNVPVPVAVPVAKSIVSNLTIVNVPVAPANRPVPFSIVATSVILAVFGGMKTPHTNKCSRQLVAIRRSEGEGPRRRVVGIYLGCERRREPTEVGRRTLSSPAGRRGRNIDNCGERTAERQLRATLRRCLSRPRRPRSWATLVNSRLGRCRRPRTHTRRERSVA